MKTIVPIVTAFVLALALTSVSAKEFGAWNSCVLRGVLIKR